MMLFIGFFLVGILLGVISLRFMKLWSPTKADIPAPYRRHHS